MTFQELINLEPGTIIKGLRVIKCTPTLGSICTPNVDGWEWLETRTEVGRLVWFPEHSLMGLKTLHVVDKTLSEKEQEFANTEEASKINYKNYDTWLFSNLAFGFKAFFSTHPFVGMYTGKYVEMLTNQDNVQVLINILADTEMGWLHAQLDEEEQLILL